MKASIEEVLAYTVCPRLWGLKGSPPLPEQGLNDELNLLLTFILRRILETESIPTWKQVQAKWTKIFWLNRDSDDKSSTAAYNRSQISLRDIYGWTQSLPKTVLGVNFLISSNLSRHNLSGEILGILGTSERTAELIYVTSAKISEDLLRDIRVRFLSSIMNSEIPVSRITSFGLSKKGLLTSLSLYPDKSFWTSSESEMSSILRSMHQRVFYSNATACGSCSVRKECLEKVTNPDLS
jgi:hypothetical protein